MRVDPHTAFTAFTDEMDNWWMRSPISYYDSSRAIARRCEPGVGGRILEVYDEAGDVLELGRITVWEPGVRLQWLSSVDDVEVEVRFAPIRGRHQRAGARACASRRQRGRHRQLLVRARRSRLVREVVQRRCDRVARHREQPARLDLAVYYRQPVAAARWLADALGSTRRHCRDDDDADVSWIEFHVGNTALLVFRLDGDAAEVRARHAHAVGLRRRPRRRTSHGARAAGATIVEPIHQYGYRAYVAEDLEGNRWTFAQARPTMD